MVSGGVRLVTEGHGDVIKWLQDLSWFEYLLLAVSLALMVLIVLYGTRLFLMALV